MKFRFSIFLFCIISCVSYLKNPHQDSFSTEYSKKEVILNKVIRDLSLFPVNGSRFRLSELKNTKAIVFVMREADCPISEKYGPRLARLEKKYSKLGIKFIYNYVGQLNPLENGKKDLKRYDFKGPYIIDSKQRNIEALSINTTGDVIIMTSERRVLYKGPLDDQFHLLKSALKPKNHFVSNRLDAILSGNLPVPKELSAPGCVISRPIVKKKLFFEDVAPIISKKCSVCHNPEGSAPINYLNYEDVANRRAMFKYVIKNDLMPPWNVDPSTGPYKNDLSLTTKEKKMLLSWVDDDSPKKGKGGTVLWKKRKLESSDTDYIIRLPEKVLVPAEGFIDWKRYIIPTNFKEDKYIKTVRFFPKPKVIHHITLYIMKESFKENLPITTSLIPKSLFRFAILRQENIQNKYWAKKDFGYKIPKKSKLVLEIHYESTGQEVVDNYTHIKIAFHKKKPKYTTTIKALATRDIKIPPYAQNYKITLSYKLKETRYLSNVLVHMHLRGKANAVFVTDPKGNRKKIFALDPFLPKFQLFYEFKNYIKIKKGSTLECVNYFDNSASNPVNPSPEKYVTWGQQLKDEMSSCVFNYIVPIN